MSKPMSFQQVCAKLGIPEYTEAIFHSNSHGELMHTADYYEIQKGKKKSDLKWFRPLFLICDAYAKKNWERPESWYQHMPKMMQEMAEAINRMP